MRRKYQQGHRKDDAWLPKEPVYVQFWADIPGQQKQRRHDLAIGICRTRTIAERTAAEKLEKLGINSTQAFIESTSTITFKQQGEIWLKSLANRKRNPLEQTTIDTRQYAMDKWIYPFFEGYLLADVNNMAMKDFVDHHLQAIGGDDPRLFQHRESSSGLGLRREGRFLVPEQVERGDYRRAHHPTPAATYHDARGNGRNPESGRRAIPRAVRSPGRLWAPAGRGSPWP